MKDKFIPILSVCTALFAIFYAGYVYQVTQSISLVTIVLLIAGLAPAIHTAWNYVKIKLEEYAARELIGKASTVTAASAIIIFFFI